MQIRGHDVSLKRGRISAIALLTCWIPLLAVSAMPHGNRPGDIETPPLTVSDCVGMVRVQQSYLYRNQDIVFSADGRQFVATVWRGNLETNRNDYRLLLFDISRLNHPPIDILEVSYVPDSHDQDATPLSQPSFIGDHRVAVLAAFDNGPRQVVLVDPTTKSRTQLTKERGGVSSFAISTSGNVMLYAAPTARGNENANEDVGRTKLFREGFSIDDPRLAAREPLYRIATGGGFYEHPGQRYVLARKGGAASLQIYEESGRVGALEAPLFWIAPDEKHAAVYPYVATGESRDSIGLIDLDSGKIERLVLSGQLALKRTVRVLWSPDSKSLAVSTFDTQSGKLG